MYDHVGDWVTNSVILTFYYAGDLLTKFEVSTSFFFFFFFGEAEVSTHYGKFGKFIVNDNIAHLQRFLFCINS